MKIAVHYNADYPAFGGYYGPPIYERVFRAVLGSGVADIDTDIFVGDVPLYRLNQSALKQWLDRSGQRFVRLYKGVDFIRTHNVFAMVFESVEEELAQYIDHALRNDEAYIGIVEVDEEIPVHRAIYTMILIPYARIVGRDLFLFWDGLLEDSKDEGMLDFFKELPFNRVDFKARPPFDEEI